MSFRQTVDAILAAVDALPVIEGLPSKSDLELMADASPLEVAEVAGNITKRRIIAAIRAVTDPALEGQVDPTLPDKLREEVREFHEGRAYGPRCPVEESGLLEVFRRELGWQAADQIEHLLAIYEQRYGDVSLISAQSDDKGQFVTELKSGMAAFMAEYCAQILKAEGAPNFVQVEAVHPELGPLTFSIERRYGRAAAVQLAEAKEEITKLKAELAGKS